jgi:formate/nitrite transporter
MSEPGLKLTLEPFSAAELAQKVESGGIAKTRGDPLNTLLLSILAGAFIALGALFSTVVATDTQLGYGPTRLLAGLAFCLGLVLVVVAGAELFTGNQLMVLAWAHGKVRTIEVLRQWLIVFLGNFIGAAATAWGVCLSGIWKLGGQKVGATALSIAAAKCSLSWDEAFVRGVFCNALVCLAVWMVFSARTTADKVLAVLFPITAFVAAGFEHSIANMYIVPFGLFLRSAPEFACHSAMDLTPLTWGDFLVRNLLPVTLGNIVGGSVLVGLMYWFIYVRPNSAKPTSNPTNTAG